MLYLFSFIIFVLVLSIIVLISNSFSNKKEFARKINLLESLIEEMKLKINNQKENLKLSDELKLNMIASNKILSTKIVDMNHSMFEELFSKKDKLT